MYSNALRSCSFSLVRSGSYIFQTKHSIVAILNKRSYQSNKSEHTNISVMSKTDDWEQVYSGMLESRIRQLKIVSFMTSGAGLFVQPLLLQKAAEVGSSLAATIGVCTIAGFFTFVTPILIHLVTRKYVTRVDYNNKNDQYLATTISFFLKPKKVLFKTHEVRLPMSQKLTITFYIRNIPLFIDPQAFTDMMHYQRILGYDKPYQLDTEFTNVVNKPVIKAANKSYKKPQEKDIIDDKAAKILGIEKKIKKPVVKVANKPIV
ncbi:transmembrane protein 70 homolog, mitochondrial [Daktulosphaira vitifoliae]|uniref:transmembrane protein 70 homolog, mitochondrial n=1 Tax=Daktulosphaira vitifoliae TaxID=58002 RepID=UPI0021AA6E5B|nr:transmembrane protein 70 homolog, mitochondrial [Daktulosphaira vitifoliae]